MDGRVYYEPLVDGVERLPTELQMFHGAPLIMRAAHWHAQVEINFIVRGWAHYKMSGHEATFSQGDLALFWGGQPHWLDEGSEDLVYAGGHLPLVHFFRLRLPSDVQAKLMKGATLVTHATDASDPINFARWNAYARSGDSIKASLAVDELLLRIERIRFSPYSLLPELRAVEDNGGLDHHTSPIVVRICEYIAENFREEIDSIDIAVAADIHPKYAMTVFKKSTGMTLNDYVNLMRLSYAQAMLMRDDASVLTIAMDSGFGSLSAFNKSFRKVAGTSPSDFRRDVRGRPVAAITARDLAHRAAL
ncbi:helix-turn-helix domain-containing protein [Devosia rhizoryzae]|uniref:Helix-turn-helix domain-containing protein n=1 Tax=Devosia rhizoryzae TaxID=2774137 RepID=A0ABX7CC90_9HYPH|nr:helix-turn-helix domain-containing protein [Devosia rhizoryzae]QQR40904.1 helix-turn-helix domain-containing protein [Devosia rhizoryzae]